MKLFAFTLDLEAEYAGTVDQYEIFKDHAAIEEFLSIMHSHGVKITAFTVAKIFEQFPGIIKIFEKYDCEFEVHSYSHNPDAPDSRNEIEKAREAYFNYFGKYPKGYRAPQGRISESGIKNLTEQGFLYDSSIFPTYYPNPFRYIFFNRNVHYHNKYNIMEIPLTSITPFRVLLSISYIKFFGIDFFIKLFDIFDLPDTICFDSHLHDFIFKEASHSKLPLYLKLFCGRNSSRGIDYCVTLLEFLKQKGYTFCYMSDIHAQHKI
jgi:hypothetical protein